MHVSSQPILSLSIIGLSLSFLSGCWVPQIVQGLPGQVTPGQVGNPSDFAALSQQDRLTSFGSRIISLSREMAWLMSHTPEINTRRQVIENFIFFNVKNSLPTWFFSGGVHSKVDAAHHSQLTLTFKNHSGQPYNYDVLDAVSYGTAPRPSTTFPGDFAHYELNLLQSLPENQSGKLKVQLQGSWPSQIPLRDNFQTTYIGFGSVDSHPFLENFNFKVNGRADRDGQVLNAQINLESTIQGQVYSALVNIDRSGVSEAVNIYQNGTVAAQINKGDKRWTVLIDGKVTAVGL